VEQYPHKPKEYVSGEAFTYLGRNYRLKVMNGCEPGVDLVNGRFCVHVPENMTGSARDERVQDELTTWFRARAAAKLPQRARMHATRMGLKLGTVGIKDYKRQWGSCYQDRSLYFNWKIVIAPMGIVDYVLVHELCHLVHHDHSRDFWKMLGVYVPDYTERKEWLRVNGSLLMV